jgi:hypothetical protein
MSKSLVGPVVSGGGDPFWSERLERDPLPEDGTGAGCRDEAGSGATGARCAWIAMPMRPRISRSKSSGRRWPRNTSGKLWRAVALLSPPQDHAQTRPRTAPSRIVRTS